MRKYIWLVVAAVVAVSLSVGVATATAAKGGNSANAKLCQKGGWMNLQGSDGTQFANQDECVSYGAHGGTIVPKPTCTAGSDNFFDDAHGSFPTTWLGGTIEGPYASGSGGIFVIAPGNPSAWPVGTHLLWNGRSTAPFRLTFTDAVSSVELEAAPNLAGSLTLKGYDAANAIVDTDTVASAHLTHIETMSVSSSTNNIKYFTMETSDTGGVLFTNIVWACA